MNKAFILFVCVSTLFVGCNNENNDNNNHGHSHLESLSHTIYTNNTELFVEFTPLIVGETTYFAAHFTKLGNFFIPIETGEVSLQLIGKNDQPSYKATQPTSAGIFKLALKPINSGKYQLKFILNTKEYTDTITINNVIVYLDTKTAESKQIKEKVKNEIVYLKEQAWNVDFANQAILKQPFSEVIKTTGHILPAQGDEVLITATNSGIITYTSDTKMIGSAVQKGEALFTIRGGGLTESNIDKDYQEAKANYEKSKADFERAQLLIKENIIAQKEFQEIERNYKNSQLSYNTIAKNYSSNGKSIVTPIKGFVKNIMVNEGQYVEVGQTIASVSQNQRLIIKAEVAQKDYAKLNSIASANFKTAYDNTVYNTDSLNGKLISYGKSSDDHAYYIPVNFEIDNKGAIIPGSFIEVYLKTNTISDALLIPFSALIEEQGIYYVYVQTSGEAFEKRELKLGANDGFQIQVLSGLEENERVVTIGAYQIKLASMSGKMPAHGHEH